MRPHLLLAVLALTVPACGGESRALQAEVMRLRAERDKLAKIAEHLDEYRVEVERLQEDLGRARQSGMMMKSDERRNVAAGVPGVTQSPVLSGQRGIKLEAKTRESLDAIFKAAPMLGVSRLTIAADGSWMIEMLAYDPTDSAAGRDWTTPEQPIPKPGLIQTPLAKRLRQEIADLGKEVAELKRLVGEVQQFEDRKRELEHLLQTFAGTDRLHSAKFVHERLFTGACTQGSIEFLPNALRFRCTPAKPDLEAAADDIRARFTVEDLSSRTLRLGPIALDHGRPDPVSGELRRVPP